MIVNNDPTNGSRVKYPKIKIKKSLMFFFLLVNTRKKITTHVKNKNPKK